jgi:hypothetical protein
MRRKKNKMNNRHVRNNRKSIMGRGVVGIVWVVTKKYSLLKEAIKI